MGSVKARNERFILSHSQKLTVEQLTDAGLPQLDTTPT
jgi:hypothetical protein